MTKLFFACLAIIASGTLYIITTQPESQNEVPVLYWVTDPNPARFEQIKLFQEWLIDNGHVTASGKPIVDLKLETGGADNKRIIHGVSGVAGDIIDASDIDQYKKLGILADVTDYATKYGFGIDSTYAALESSLFYDGRQYGFPCNVTTHACWVNKNTFRNVGMDVPPESWTVEEFERIGKEFVQRANKGKSRQDVFFMNQPSDWLLMPWMMTLIRSMGDSIFNETMTDTRLDSGSFEKALQLNQKWIEEDHLFPSAAEASSFNSEGGFGGSQLSLFLEGNYAMITIGRWMLVRLREIESPPEVSVSRYPYFYNENSVIMTRAATIYKGTKYPELAALFLSYLASEKYNKQIVDCADALPPNPKFCNSDDFLRPSDHKNEWGAHEVPFRSATSIAIPEVKSPYISYASLTKYIREANEKVLSHLCSPKIAAEQAASAIRLEINRNLKNSPTLQDRYAEETEIQKEIDLLKKDRGFIPLNKVKNPYFKNVYAAQNN